MRTFSCRLFSGACLALIISASIKAFADDAKAVADPLPQYASMRLGTTRFRHWDGLWDVAFSCDGKWIVSTSKDGTVRVWDAATGKQLACRNFAVGSNLATTPPSAAAFNHQGDSVAVGNLLGIWWWEWKSKNSPKKIAVSETMLIANATELSRFDVASLAFSADGKLLAWVDRRSKITVRNLATNQDVFSTAGNANWVFNGLLNGILDSNSLVFSPDCKILALRVPSGKIRLWAMPSFKEMAPLEHKESKIEGIAFSPDGSTLALSLDARNIMLWDVHKEQERARFYAEGGHALVFSPDGRLLATLGSGGRISLLSATTGRPITSFQGQWSGAIKLAFSPNGKTLVAVGEDEAIRSWDVQTGRELLIGKGHLARVSAIAISPDNRLLVSASHDRRVLMWDTRTGQLLREIEAHAKNIESIGFSPTGKLFATGGNDRCLKLWDANSGKEIKTIHPGQKVFNVAFGRGGSLLACDGPDGVDIYDVATGQRKYEIPASHAVYRVLWSPDGQELAVAMPKRLLFWDAASNHEKNRFELESEVFVEGLAYSPDGNRLAVASFSWPGEAHIYKRGKAGWTKEKCLYYKDSFLSVAFLRQGEILACGTKAGTIVLWDIRRERILAELRGHCGEVLSLACSSDGKMLASGNSDTTILIWNLKEIEETLFGKRLKE